MERTFSKTEDYELVLQLEEDTIFLHIDVVNWGKSVFKSIQKDMQDILHKTKEQGWGEIYAYTPNVKFANMVEPCEIVASMDGREDLTIVKWITR